MSPITTITETTKTRPTSVFNFAQGEILNINKPEGWTSFDVVNKIRKHIGVKKVGHAGTLDPFATGVLLICTGKATKRVPELMGLEKEYEAIIELGKTTDTYDRTGIILQEKATTDIGIEEVRHICEEFQGKILQTPPMYSAVKVKGKRLYELARRGEVIDRKPRSVVIRKINILSYHEPFLHLDISCSKGTYIRALANDIGEKLGCGGMLNELTRTRIGDYKLEDASSLNDFLQLIYQGR